MIRLLVFAALIATCGVAHADDADAPPGTQQFPIADRHHTQGTVHYPQTPPVGGPHNPVWQNCGFYSQPVANENAVHSMEHGVVWITYTPDLSDYQALRSLIRPHVLISPYPGLPSPLVASAWGRQLQLNSPLDPRLPQFVDAFTFGQQAPEPHGPCEGGTGEPG
jgi:Protein of unknown function (DUF3105)